MIRSNGVTANYSYGFYGKFDVELVPLEFSNLEIGDVVARGPDWKWENQDGRLSLTLLFLFQFFN